MTRSRQVSPAERQRLRNEQGEPVEGPGAGTRGNGPAFALATPTGGQGAVSYDLTSMAVVQRDAAFMFRHTWRYSPTPRIQLNLSMHTPVLQTASPQRTRGGTMMSQTGDIELSALWRFHQTDLGIGKRFESTLIGSAGYPTEKRRGGVRPGPSFHAAAVTGYASRTVYFWGGAGVQQYAEKGSDKLGDLRYLSFAFAWRPPLFAGDYPKPDWRIFVESIAEFTGRDRIAGAVNQASGGSLLMAGPSLLGLYAPGGYPSAPCFRCMRT